MKNSVIKTITLLLIAVMLITAFAACNKPDVPVDNSPAPTEQQAEAPTEAPTAAPTEAPTEAPAADPAITEAAWAIAEKIEEVHGQKFDKDGATVKLSEHFAEVRFPCVTYEEEVLVVTVEKDGEGSYKADAESVYAELAEGARDRLNARFDPDATGEKQEEFRKAEITVTADEIRARGCEAEIGSDEYKAAAAAVYGEKLAEYYRGSLTEDSPFCCYDVRCVGTETNDDYEDSYNVLIGFRFRDMLLFSYLFDYGPTYEDGMLYPGYEGWLVGWTLVEVELRDDGSFVANAWLNSAA
ncbi:MAG: PT domain-containing protein [Clostridiales bacterium]|nr:PT domain-containing protein [Clostridiales bacterium]